MASRAKVEMVHFFMVWTKTGSKPRYMHRTRSAAEEEAARLAFKNPSKKFIVLQAVSKHSLETGE